MLLPARSSPGSGPWWRTCVTAVAVAGAGAVAAVAAVVALPALEPGKLEVVLVPTQLTPQLSEERSEGAIGAG